jgi:glycosyltransferase involved in cell wall biosynthesis
MKISIIIPSYNEKKFLPDLISLVNKSPVQKKEIILFDDGSNDGTTDLIRNYTDMETGYKLFKTKFIKKSI